MKYYLIAGEASGDLHASNLIKSIQKTDANASFRCLGGDLMADTGAELAFHFKEIAFAGIFEILANLRVIKKYMKMCQVDIIQSKPDVVILVDYPGFNLRMAKYCKKAGFKVAYYIAPKTWASRESRLKTITKYVDKLFSILPFETRYFEKHGVPADFVGNPVVDAVNGYIKSKATGKAFLENNQLDEKPVIAILPGSRKQEVSKILPEMMKVIPAYKDYQFVIAGVNMLGNEVYAPFLGPGNVKLVFNQTYDLLNNSVAAIVASGTATLETALFNVPQVVCYRLNTLTYRVGMLFYHSKYFSLVNLICDREVVKEILQFNLPVEIKAELDRILFQETHRQQMLSDYDDMKSILGEEGASGRAAKAICEFVKKNSG